MYFPSMSRSAVRVLAFGRYAEVLGAETLEIDLLPGATVRDMLQVIRERPGGNLLPQQVLCAVNLGQVDAEHVLRAGDELALLPPLAGG